MRGDPKPSREKRQELARAAGLRIGGEGCWGIGGNIIGRADGNGGHQLGVVDPDENGMFSLTATDRHAVAFAANQRGEVRLQGGEGDVFGAIPTAWSGKQAQGVVAPRTYGMAYKVGAKAKAYPFDEELHPTLSASRHDASCLCMASGQANAEIGSDMAPAQTARQFKDPQIACIADDNAKAAVDVDMCDSLKVGGAPPMIGTKWEVRRLTPRECERLQGFPDDWSRIPWRGRPAGECPDAPRYKALGNSMAVPVMRWIGERIAMVERESKR